MTMVPQFDTISQVVPDLQIPKKDLTTGQIHNHFKAMTGLALVFITNSFIFKQISCELVNTGNTMIDTIVLKLTKNKYTITKPELVTPSALWVLADATGIRGVKSKQNPGKKELAVGFYKPRLTLSKQQNRLGGYKTVLKIELSLPKLLFGNNFDELQRKDFLPLVKKLVSMLQSRGVETTANILAQALVSAIHYSKNIPLTDGSTPYHYINKIKEANIKLSLDVNQTDYPAVAKALADRQK